MCLRQTRDLHGCCVFQLLYCSGLSNAMSACVSGQQTTTSRYQGDALFCWVSAVAVVGSCRCGSSRLRTATSLLLKFSFPGSGTQIHQQPLTRSNRTDPLLHVTGSFIPPLIRSLERGGRSASLLLKRAKGGSQYVRRSAGL